MLRAIKKYAPEILILFLVVGIFISNYVPGTYLIGWDGLQTEFYPWLAIKRAFFSVWQEYQSFGLPTGMAHAADLVRALFLFLLSFVLRADLIRYLFHHLMLLVGGLGAIKLFRFLGFKSKKEGFALLGAIFYILNLGTVQMFGVPFEPFSVFFAFLPWEIYFFLIYLESQGSSRKPVFSLLVVNLLATPQAYQQTIFVVYILILGLISLGLLITKSLTKKGREIILRIFGRIVKAFVVIFIVNSFWILPQLYSVKYSSNMTRQSKINQLATDTMIKQNIEKGKIKYLARFENFYYDLQDADGQRLFTPWVSYFESKWLYIASFIPFVFIIAGLVLGKKRYDLSLILVYLFMMFVFLSGTVPFSAPGEFLRKVSIFGQIFRSPFTKFVFPHVLISSYFFALGVEAIYSLVLGKVSEGKFSNFICSLYLAPFFFLVLIISKPAFDGNYFLPQVKLKVPDQYLQAMRYFKGRDVNERVALLPDYTFWGWFRNDWGYNGSGFIWYGIEQPIISRTFDVWSKESESYFWEIKHAIESQDVEKFEKVLSKYNIRYLIVDYSMKSVTSAETNLQYDQIAEIVRRSGRTRLLESYDRLHILEFEQPHPTNNFSSISSDLPNIGLEYDVTDYDSAYFDSDYYYTSTSKDYDVVYPFMDLGTQTDRFSRNWLIVEDEDSFLVKSYLGYDYQDYQIIDDKELLRAKVFDGTDIKYYELGVDVYLDQEGYLITKVRKELLERVIPAVVGEVINCRGNLGSFGSEILENDHLKVHSENRGTSCFSFFRPFLAHWNSYLVDIRSQNISGDPLFFYIVGSKSSNYSKIESNIFSSPSYFILPNGNVLDDGYTFGFQNISYEDRRSENILQELNIYLFPFEYLKNLRLSRKGFGIPNVSVARVSNTHDISKINYATFYVNEGSTFYNTVIIHQSYNPGWVALCRRDICDAKHVKINGWANGWVFKESIPGQIIIIFWPQVLQFAGLLALILFTIPVLAFHRRKHLGEESDEKRVPLQ